MSSGTQALKLRCAAIGIAAAVTAATPCFASGTIGALLACRTIEVSAARLQCFDRESAALAAQRNTARPNPALSPRQTFGLAPMAVAARAEAAAHAPKPLDSLTARIASVGKAADGREIFTLVNHQVWVQLVADGHWLDARPGETVTISRGWLGSYRLSLPSRRGFKVTRLR
jgi:hypothetical protein